VTNTNVAFCCSFATYTDLEIYGGSGVDLICLTDASIHHCNDETGDAVADVFDSDSYIECGSGNDRVDTAVSGVHVDEVYGESGEDIIVTYNGADDIDGGADDDTIDCGDGPDKAFGGAGDDTIYGGIGADQLIGGANNDEIYGQSGDDDICGSTGADTLYGGANDDCICHNESGQVSDGVSDYLEGSTGADQGFWWPGTPDFDTDDGSITLLETCTCDCP
jgi:Ca2+-binding RTX toxin-like protein